MQTINIILLALIVLLQVADGVSTVLVIRAGGYEANKAIAFLIGIFGEIPTLLLIKSLVIFAAAGVYESMPASQVTTVLFAAIILVYCYVAYHNFSVLKSIRS